MNYAVLIIFLILFGFLCLKNFKLGIGLFVFLLPSYIIRFQFAQVPTTLLELCFFILVIGWLFYIKKSKTKFASSQALPASWLAPIALFFIAATIGIFISPDRVGALGIWKAYFVEPILFFIILLTTIRTKKDWQNILQTLIFSGLAVALFAAYQKFTGAFIPQAWLAERRVTSIFGYPNAVGLFLGPLIIICFYFIFKSAPKKSINVAFYTASLVIFSLAIFWSKTEAAWIAVAAGLFLFCLFQKRLRLPAIILFGLIILFLTFTPTLRDAALEKIMLTDWSGHVRLVTWSESLEMLKHNIVFGAGMAGYPLAMVAFHKVNYIEIFQYPHNFILNFWSETGILGLVAWLWLLILALIASFRKIKITSLAPLMISIIAVVVIHGLVDVPYFKNDLSMMFWIFIGLAAWLNTAPSQEIKKEA